MANTPNAVLPIIEAAENARTSSVPKLVSLTRKIDALMQLGAVSATTSAQPGSPTDGQVYILPAGKTGAAWATFADGGVALYSNGAWLEITPREGWLAFVGDTDTLYVFTGAVWQRFPLAYGGASGMLNGSISESHASNAVTFSVKTQTGATPSTADPVYFVMPTAAGGFAVRAVTSALSITIASGATMGATSAQPFRLWLAALDNAGTIELVVRNCASSAGIAGFPANGLITTTVQAGGGDDSALVSYSATARTDKPYILLGYASFESGLTTAGTWDASPSALTLYRPGGYRPGDIVQRRSHTTTSETDVTSTSFQPTTSAVSLTPTSACNPVQIDVVGTLGNTVASKFSTGVVIRGGVEVGPYMQQYSQGGLFIAQAVLSFVDRPATTSATTWTHHVKTTSGGTAFWNNSVSGTGSCISATEIMA